MGRNFFKYHSLLILMFMTSCNTLPQLYQAAEDIADDDAVSVKVSREAIQKQTDVNVAVDIKNNPAIGK